MIASEESHIKLIIKKWGNNLAVQIPAAIAKSLNIGVNQKVNIEINAGKIIITPVANVEYEKNGQIYSKTWRYCMDLKQRSVNC